MDLIILGAGPAGASAAIEAADLGLRTLIVDEQPEAGGQVWRAPAPEGDALRRRLKASGARCAFSHRVWLIERGFTLSALGPEGPVSHAAPALIVATGAQERHVPVPGWTLPGVIGLAAATILLKSQEVLPGRRVVVAGAGPLLPLVANLILAGGGGVAAVIDANRRRDWLRRPGALLSRPDLTAAGAGWAARLRLAGVPHLFGHLVHRVIGTTQVEGVIAARDGATREFPCDAVCYGFGLMPATEATRLLNAAHRHDPALGGWTPEIDADQATSVANLYACGDGAGVQGAAAAPLRGRIAAIAAARDLGRLSAAAAETRLRPLRAGLARAARFGAAMTALATPPPGMAGAITPETVVCRCEGLPRVTLDAAITLGAVTINDLKSATRCGMGACGGRNCEEAAALLIAAATGRTRAAIGQATGRPPLRPVPLHALAGAFDYETLPMPEPAPL